MSDFDQNLQDPRIAALVRAMSAQQPNSVAFQSPQDAQMTALMNMGQAMQAKPIAAQMAQPMQMQQPMQQRRPQQMPQPTQQGLGYGTAGSQDPTGGYTTGWMSQLPY